MAALAVLLAVTLTAGLTCGPGQVSAVIRPRFDLAHGGWWRRTSSSSSSLHRQSAAPRPADTFSVFNTAGPLPPYSFVSNSAPPKPPPGYHFSAGPKPARFAAAEQPVTPAPARDAPLSPSRTPPLSPPLPPPQRSDLTSDPDLAPSPGPDLTPARGRNLAPARGRSLTPAPEQPRVAFPRQPIKNPLPDPRPAAEPTDQAGFAWRKTDEKNKGASNDVSSGAAGAPSSCGPLCLPYRLLARTPRHETRLYPDTVWVSFVTATENRLLAEMEALAGIEDYLAGDNGRGDRLPRAHPTLTQLRFSPVHKVTAQEQHDFSVSVPLLDETNPPRPSTDQLVLDVVSSQRVFVTSFWARPWKLSNRSLRVRTRRFSRRLRRAGETFLDAFFYLAKYKDTNSEQQSYYEIWLYSTPSQSEHRFRPMGKPLLDKRSNITADTMNRLCRGRECPRFEVLSEYEGGIQKRHYYNAAFATSKLERCESSLESIWHGLIPLHLYRQGVNSHLARIEPTRPAGMLRVWETHSGGNTTCHMTAMVYLPRRLHRSPPNTAQHAPPIGLSYIHELTVYVQTAGGRDLGPGPLADRVAALHARLDRLGLCYRRGEYFLAVYDAEQRYHGRLNEIWTVARRCRRA